MKKENLTIEESFTNLDKIISQMDDEKCSIEKSIELYEKGAKIINELNKKVIKIEKDIKVLSDN